MTDQPVFSPHTLVQTVALLARLSGRIDGRVFIASADRFGVTLSGRVSEGAEQLIDELGLSADLDVNDYLDDDTSRTFRFWVGEIDGIEVRLSVLLDGAPLRVVS
jgi:hypothetical protein